MSDQPFDIGDVVRRKDGTGSAGAVRAVGSLESTTGKVSVQWFYWQGANAYDVPRAHAGARQFTWIATDRLELITRRADRRDGGILE